MSRSAGVTKSGSDTVDRQKNRVKQIFPRLTRLAIPPQKLDLKIAQRIDVGIAQLDGLPEHRGLLQEKFLLRDLKEPRAGPLVFLSQLLENCDPLGTREPL